MGNRTTGRFEIRNCDTDMIVTCSNDFEAAKVACDNLGHTGKLDGDHFVPVAYITDTYNMGHAVYTPTFAADGLAEADELAHRLQVLQYELYEAEQALHNTQLQIATTMAQLAQAQGATVVNPLFVAGQPVWYLNINRQWQTAYVIEPLDYNKGTQTFNCQVICEEQGHTVYAAAYQLQARDDTLNGDDKPTTR